MKKTKVGKDLNEVETDKIFADIWSKWNGMSEEEFDAKTEEMFRIVNEAITDELKSLKKSNKKSTKNNEK